MSDESPTGLYLGQALTNTQLNSSLQLIGEAYYSLTLQFVPAGCGRYASEDGAGKSKDIRGALLYLRTEGRTRLAGNMRLGGLKTTHWYNGAGSKVAVKAHCVTLDGVKSTDTVTVYFGRDALSDQRSFPIFRFSDWTGNRTVTIFERPGKHAHSEVLVLDHVDILSMQWWSGDISGDTWKSCSPEFSTSYARTLLSEVGFTEAVPIAAVEAIYDGDILPEANNEFQLKLAAPRPDDPAAQLVLVWHKMGWGPSSNPGSHVTSFDPRLDVPQRVHPYAFAAVVSAAVACEASAVLFTSSWRPLLGSVGHRQGVCLDLGAVTDKQGNLHLFKWESLTPAEQAVHDELAAAQGEARDRKVDHVKATQEVNKTAAALKKREKELQALQRNIAKLQTSGHAAAKALADFQALPPPTTPKAMAAHALKLSKLAAAAKAAQARLADATTKLADVAAKVAEAAAAHADALAAAGKAKLALAEADLALAQAELKWDQTARANQPGFIADFRQRLLDSPLVSQVIDPWLIDTNTRDKVAAEANQRTSSLETIHLNHLHLTCRDPDIQDFD